MSFNIPFQCKSFATCLMKRSSQSGLWRDICFLSSKCNFENLDQKRRKTLVISTSANWYLRHFPKIQSLMGLSPIFQRRKGYFSSWRSFDQNSKEKDFCTDGQHCIEFFLVVNVGVMFVSNTKKLHEMFARSSKNHLSLELWSKLWFFDIIKGQNEYKDINCIISGESGQQLLEWSEQSDFIVPENNLDLTLLYAQTYICCAISEIHLFIF